MSVKKSVLFLFLMVPSFSIFIAAAQVKDRLYPLPEGNLQLSGYLEQSLSNSLTHWNMGVVPYDSLAQVFKKGRSFFAQGEMWGKAVRSGCMFYRYNRDPRLKLILKHTINVLLSYKRENGSLSCSAPHVQPDGPGGDIWERKYVMLALEGYYSDVEKDPAVLAALVQQADLLLTQVGPSPKIPITDLGWSPNHIESSTVLEPVMRLYALTGYKRYLDFAHYIIITGGTKGENIIESAYLGKDPAKMGGAYPKAYEMLSLFEGVLEYYRATGNRKWLIAALNLFEKVKQKEITIIGNGGGDQPYHPNVYGEAWDYTAFEQTNPDIKRMMETCVGVTWLKFCSQILRLTEDPSAMDRIEQYAYNGLIGAMKPEGDGFSYVNLLNGVKTNSTGWGGIVNSVPVTCCNLNGPMGLAYLPYVAVMQTASGSPVINLFNPSSATMSLRSGTRLQLSVLSAFPQSGRVLIRINTTKNERFPLKIRIPAWSRQTCITVSGKQYPAVPGTYLEIDRYWKKGDEISVQLDMRCRVLHAPKGSNRLGDNYQALMVGPVVLARDETTDSSYNTPVTLSEKNGIVAATPVKSNNPYMLSFKVPTNKGYIHMVDYASVNNWNGKHICTWLPTR